MPEFYSLPEQMEVTMTLSNPSQLTVGETLYYDESTSQLIFKGGPYYLIG